eukprot:SAG11_NODE_420_length_9631_cov_12.805558_6_plen_181_part_00
MQKVAAQESAILGIESGVKDGNEMKVDDEEKRLLSIWAKLDTDGSGFLDEEECKAVFTAMGHVLTDRKFSKEFRKIDKDGNGEVSSGELLVWWRKQKAKVSKHEFDGQFAALCEPSSSAPAGGAGVGGIDEEESRLQQIWALVDVDGSGALDEQEVRKVFHGMGQVRASDRNDLRTTVDL